MICHILFQEKDKYRNGDQIIRVILGQICCLGIANFSNESDGEQLLRIYDSVIILLIMKSLEQQARRSVKRLLFLCSTIDVCD